MSDTVQIVTAVITFLSTVLTAVMAYLIARLQQQATLAAVAVRVAAVKVEEVKNTLDISTTKFSDKLDSITTTGNAVHVLVNNSMAIQLKLNAVMSRRLATMTRGSATGLEDDRAATLAEKLYREHEDKQNIVDSKIIPPPN